MTTNAYIGLFRSHSSGKWTAMFPDLPGCTAEGKDLDDARTHAARALRDHLGELGEAPPTPRSPAELIMDAHGDWSLARQFVDAIMQAVGPADEDFAPADLVVAKASSGGQRDPGLGF